MVDNGPEATAEVLLEPGALAIADLHLPPDRPAPAHRLRSWLDAQGSPPTLLILGDLFDFWIGPAQARFPGTEVALAALAEATARGTRIHVVPGNRDFLLDRAFERRTGARIHPDGLVARTPDGARLLCLHGDELCTLDRRYQRLRRILRSAPVRWGAPRLPGLALVLARRLRHVSNAEVRAKPAAEVTMQSSEALRVLRASGADLLVCGHGHRFREERFAAGERWWVLGAFGTPRDTLRVRSDGSLEVSEGACG